MVGDFGRTTGESFLDLVKALDKVEGIKRYRISSLEPDLITDELIDYCAHSRAFMPHFHIPLQSGSDTVLKLMHRHYDSALFKDRILRIKEAMPDAFIGVDVMVGCRGETPECFEETYNFMFFLIVNALAHLLSRYHMLYQKKISTKGHSDSWNYPTKRQKLFTYYI